MPFASLSNEDFYRVYTNQFDEIVAAEDLCDSEELARLRNYLDKQQLEWLEKQRDRVKEDSLLVVQGKVLKDEFTGGLRVVAEELIRYKHHDCTYLIRGQDTTKFFVDLA